MLLTTCERTETRHRMPMETERLAEEHQRREITAHSYALVTAALALIMITVGSVYWEDCK